mmetsp:Transcript_7160/g.17452  ORF Transcript_7160/g.17452 Transcript_7160/m.17452 type:complete len:213 (+) Transcript_7160:130-768(+)|eukprot:CAMPEP_0197176100 /NCGR_PEP_ID=MMETSP1423-20130617/2146_1 /TAXON_ID=476441 /ORGANISM="Pseudo-nitzschia heimii, Strain UNC1101" /LENGTH=212 /DNA_ID=CAMNT_0042625417 /DNA_START=105 /DNA_END=743 /DNA_ORIENTATION=-
MTYYATILLVCLLALMVAIDAKPSARLRGRHLEALEELARNPRIDAAIHGKTLKELGIEESNNQDKLGRRYLQTDEEMTLRYFSVFDEFDTSSLSNLGETAGSRGMIYDTNAKEDGLLEEYVEGALQGTCSLVTSDGKQLCNYEFFLMDSSSGALGTVVATGTVKNELDTNSVLIIEATGDNFIEYKGGMVVIKYTAIGEKTVMDLAINLKR